MTATTWHGKQREFARLQRAVGEHCDCLDGVFATAPRRCSAHDLLTDQSTLDHLLYVYRMRNLFIKREFSYESQTAAASDVAPVASGSPLTSWGMLSASVGGIQ